jgi:hypothetical protein
VGRPVPRSRTTTGGRRLTTGAGELWSTGHAAATAAPTRLSKTIEIIPIAIPSWTEGLGYSDRVDPRASSQRVAVVTSDVVS